MCFVLYCYSVGKYLCLCVGMYRYIVGTFKKYEKYTSYEYMRLCVRHISDETICVLHLNQLSVQRIVGTSNIQHFKLKHS